MPVKFGSDGTMKMTAPPMLGEHTDQILRDVLGYAGSEMSDEKKKSRELKLARIILEVL